MPLFIKRIPLLFILCYAAGVFLWHSLEIMFGLWPLRPISYPDYVDILIVFLWGVSATLIVGGFYLLFKRNMWLLGASLGYTGVALISVFWPTGHYYRIREFLDNLDYLSLESSCVKMLFVAAAFMALHLLVHKAWPALKNWDFLRKYF